MLRLERTILLGLACAGMAATAEAQRFTSPAADTSATIAGKQISVDYYAPSMHGRKVMGGLVPYGEVWCTGANIATKLTTAADIDLGGLKLPKGSYSIWTLPTAKDWTLIVNSETGQYHLNYDRSRDVGRTKMTVKPLLLPVETFQIQVSSAGGNTGTLALKWENTEVSVPITVLH